MIAKKKKELPRTRGVFERPKGSGIYWIRYVDQWGYLHREKVGPKSLAIAAYRKRKTQIREGKFFPEMIRPKRGMRFHEVTKWYLNLPGVKKLRTYDRVQGCLANFNKAFGDRVVNTIKLEDLENYQDKREKEGRAPATIDMELTIVKTMVTKAFDNDKVDANALKAFRKVKRKLSKGSNARKRPLTIPEYLSLLENAPHHLRPILETAYNTGMRRGELLSLRWSHIDRKSKMIRFPLGLTKEGRKKKIPEDSPLRKNIPINHHVERVLDALPRSLHNEYVYTYNRQPIKKLRRSFGTACNEAGIPHGRKTENGVTFHDIRGTVKSNMRRAGVDKAARDTILGHSLEGMDVHYLTLEDEDLKLAMDKYTAWLDSQIATSTSTDTGQKERIGQVD